MLLPLLASVVIAQGSQAEVGTALHDGVRARLGQGWSVADIRVENADLAVTLFDPLDDPRDGRRVERHVAHVDGDESDYRVEDDAKLPTDRRSPSEFMLLALAQPRGGIELGMECGEYYEIPYVRVAAGTTRFDAGRLVAWTLATADDLRSAIRYDQIAIYEVERDGHVMKLHVKMDRDGAVLEAQLRRYGDAVDVVKTYKRSRQLAQALRGTRVTAIDATGRIMTPRGQTSLDPHGTAFANEYDDAYEGCGC